MNEFFENPKLCRFYIDGAWVEPDSTQAHAVIDPATEKPLADIAMGSGKDIDRAVTAARAAFDTYSVLSKSEKIDLLKRVLAIYTRRGRELAYVMTREMGAPIRRTTDYMINVGRIHQEEIIRLLEQRDFETRRGSTRIRREPVGVCALITPWNAPITQILSKVAPALAAGCTMVLKPSEVSPFNAHILAEILDEAGLPPGVFNLVNGSGHVVGEALANHPQVDMISFTGSTAAGISVARSAAATVKRVHQELGGKSANLVLDDVDLRTAISGAVRGCYANSGQSCVSPSRLLVPEHLYDAAVAIAKDTAEAFITGDPLDVETELGPLANAAQYSRVQMLIKSGIDEGAELITGGLGRPDGVKTGYFTRPTVFGKVSVDMAIATQEIFGPVLCIMTYRDEDEAVRIANDTAFGLAAHVQCRDLERAERIAARLRAGYVYVNYSAPDYSAPFGGYKQSGNGREYGEWGLEAFHELKSIVGVSE